MRDDRLLLASSIEYYGAILGLFKDVDRGDTEALAAWALLKRCSGVAKAAGGDRATVR